MKLLKTMRLLMTGALFLTTLGLLSGCGDTKDAGQTGAAPAQGGPAGPAAAPQTPAYAQQQATTAQAQFQARQAAKANANTGH